MLLIKGTSGHYHALDMAPTEISYLKAIFSDRIPGLAHLLSMSDQQLKVSINIKSDVSMTEIRKNIDAEYEWLKNLLHDFKKFDYE